MLTQRVEITNLNAESPTENRRIQAFSGLPHSRELSENMPYPFYLNGEILTNTELHLPTDDRGFRFGDGLFETIILNGHGPGVIPYHLERLTEGFRCLGMKPEAVPTTLELVEIINKLTPDNDNGRSRIRIFAWRKGGGLYAPLSDEANLVVTWAPAPEAKEIPPAKVGICESTVLVRTAFSHCKTISALPYVMAGAERDRKGLDDLILLDAFGNVSECVSSNIFWKAEGVWFTPSLDTGCVAGVTRRRILEMADAKGITIKETRRPIRSLLMAESVFTANTGGLRNIVELEGKRFPKRERLTP
ncbi:4-amino-4-deoxychorismate lyase [Fulvitalea axinellae]|uniref:branched-chain-amino-acid transaminase n=1 Tax=Fulvitalea axinellae TaxID=1182444 RepID=A0AAU9CFJ6_9BACT|nr:4-amino-4-deoxychorismate lyase [Fulvitalea axinellae]